MTVDPLLDQALQAVEAHPDGHLPLPLRRRIRRRFGPLLGVANGGPTEGLPAAVRLDRLAAERVERHWDAGTGHDPAFRRMLDLADEVLTGTVQPEQAERETDRFELVADDLQAPGGHLRAGLAGLAAARVVSCALWGDYSEELAADADDEDLDSDAWETAFLASLAESSAPDQPDYDPEARRAFWRWYLRDAIPSIDQDRHP
jgi:immunity protein Imm5 of predicted polymorphic toxin system